MGSLPELRKQWAISCLVPDLPSTADIVPYLEQIDRNRWYSNFGPLVRDFENALSRYICGEESEQISTVTLSSATLALELTLQAAGLPKGARVLLPSLTFPATILAVLRCGYTPVLADVDPGSWALSPEYAVQAAGMTHIDAVIPVAPFGYPLPIASWDSFHSESGIPVFIDAAGALGTQDVSTGVPVIFSLHATKPLGIGEGGVLVSSDVELATRVRKLSNFGFGAGEIEQPGTNAKLSEYHAAVGLAQLARAETLLQKRMSVLESYKKHLPHALFNIAEKDLTPPAVLPLHFQGHADKYVAELTGQKIETRRWYCPPLHQQKIFSGIELCNPLDKNRLDVAEHLGSSLVGIPFHTHLSEHDIATVAEAVLLALPEGL